MSTMFKLAHASDDQKIMGQILEAECDEGLLTQLMALIKEEREKLFKSLLTKDMPSNDFLALLRAAPSIKNGLKRSCAVMAKLPEYFQPIDNEGNGDCLFASIGQAIGKSASDIRKMAADCLFLFIEAKTIEYADAIKENGMTAWSFISGHCLVQFKNEEDALTRICEDHKDEEIQKKEFQKLIRQPCFIWGDSYYIEMIQLHNEFPLNIALFDLTDPLGVSMLPHMHCYLKDKDNPNQQNWLLLLRTWTTGSKYGGGHYMRLLPNPKTTCSSDYFRQLMTTCQYDKLENLSDHQTKNISKCMQKIINGVGSSSSSSSGSSSSSSRNTPAFHNSKRTRSGSNIP
jgi:hypothetical protein